MRGGLYARVSTDDQAEGGISLTVQQADARRYIVQHGWTVAGEYVDAGFSGLDAQRPQYQRLLADARSGKLEAIVVWRLDRLGRDPAELFPRLRELNRLGIEVFSVTEPDNPLVRGIMVLMAEDESRRISARVRPAMEARVRAGMWVSTVPFGYRIKPLLGPTGRPQGRTLEPSDEAPVVQELFSRYSSGRCSLSDLVRWLNTLTRPDGTRLTTPAGRPFSRGWVHNVLTNPVYGGKVVWNRRGYGRFTSPGSRPPEEVIEASGLHPPLVDLETWQRVQQIMAHHRRAPAAVLPSDYLCTGLIFCSRCASKMYGGRRLMSKLERRPYVFRWYQCSRKQASLTCEQGWVSAEIVESAVKGALRRLRFGPKAKDAARRQVEMWFRDQGHQREARRSDLLRQRADHEERVKKLAWGWLDGKVSDATLRSMQEEVEKALALIDRELQSAESVTADPQIEEALAFIERASWDDLDFEGWRRAVQLLVERVEVKGREVVVRLKLPVQLALTEPTEGSDPLASRDLGEGLPA
jgi:site-specific DNA recombinase